MNGNGRLQFGGFEWDPQSGKLLLNGEPVRIQPQPLRLLQLFLQRPGETLSRDELRNHIWSGATFVEFDQGLNYCIRQIRLALGDNAARPVYLETLPKQGYRFLAPVIHSNGNGTSVASNLVADVFDSSRVVSNPSIETRHRAWKFLTGACALLLAVGAAWIYLAHQPHIASLAVLPLNNFSGDPGQDYFADGMTDELITMLARNSKLRIVSHTSAMQYKNAHRPLSRIARDLGVDGILEGSILRSADRIRLTVQLIDARQDTHIWAESFDRDRNDSAALSSEVAQAVAYVRPEAHDAYLHGRYLWFGRRYDEAGEYFLKASQLQPDYPLAWTGVADYYVGSTVDGHSNPRDSLWRAKAAALKAASLDDSLAQVHVSSGAVAYFVDWDWPKALGECDRAIALDPKFSEAYQLKAKVLASLGSHKEAIELVRKEMELNPFARPWALVLQFNWARLYDAAIQEAEERLESTRADPGLLIGLSYAYRCKGSEREAAEYEEKAIQVSGNSALAEEMAKAFTESGYRGLLQTRLDDLKRLANRQYVSPVTLASFTAQLGDREQTLALLEQGYEEHSPLLLNIQFNPAYDFLHREDRYRSIIKRIQLPLDHG
jgi:TolB-like protein/DNA-binding winged helix-turn-helix (wHTH) protein